MTEAEAVIQGDCREIMAGLPADSFHACITDPPYEIGFMGREWDRRGVAFDPATWAAVLRVLRPGAHLLAFGGSRTVHRMTCAIEDAGFEIRDVLMWVYGSGMPKSLDISKALDKAAGAEREIVGKSARHVSGKENQKTEGLCGTSTFAESIGMGAFITAPSTEEAKQWAGFGTNLKPAYEPIILARKPLAGTVAQNVLRYGCGGLNIDATRVPLGPVDSSQVRTMNRNQRTEDTAGQTWGLSKKSGDVAQVVQPEGRWPASFLHDGSPEVMAVFPDAPGQITRARTDMTEQNNKVYGALKYDTKFPEPRADSGSAARFYYCAKATKAERAGSLHPTVKPLALMRWLARLVVPPGGLLLDPFAGSGTTGEAALLEGFRPTLIEQKAEYLPDIRARLARAKYRG